MFDGVILIDNGTLYAPLSETVTHDTVSVPYNEDLGCGNGLGVEGDVVWAGDDIGSQLV